MNANQGDLVAAQTLLGSDGWSLDARLYHAPEGPYVLTTNHSEPVSASSLEELLITVLVERSDAGRPAYEHFYRALFDEAGLMDVDEAQLERAIASAQDPCAAS